MQQHYGVCHRLRRRSLLSSALFLLSLFQPINAFANTAQQCALLETPSLRSRRVRRDGLILRSRSIPRHTVRLKQKDLDGEDQIEDKRPVSMEELFANEEGEEKDPFKFENMSFLDRFNKAVTTTAYGFLIISFLLPAFGYTFMKRDGKLTIDTMENFQFQQEVNRVVKSDARAAGTDVAVETLLEK